MAKTPYDIDLDRNPANYQPLTPLAFSSARPRYSPTTPPSSTAPCAAPMREFYARARRLGSALAKRGIKRGDTVSVIARQYAGDARVPLRRADDRRVLNTLNTRLDAAIIAFSLDHAEAKVADHRSRILAR